MKKALTPEAQKASLEAKACGKLIKEFSRIEEKLKRAVEKEKAARQADLETVLQYKNEQEIQDAYGWDMITEEQYHLFLDLLESEAATAENIKTAAEISLRMIRQFRSEIETEQRELKLLAMTPQDRNKELEREEASVQAWKAKLAEIKKRRRRIDANEQSGEAETKIDEENYDFGIHDESC